MITDLEESATLESQREGHRIKRLPPALAEKIAAGEVIERPASIIKELMENSLDAGATKIDIQITEGGLSRIEVLDNGKGIFLEDLPLAVENHATAKISGEADLENIVSYGFRGEALASIGAVSELTLISSVDKKGGHCLQVKEGIAEEIIPAALPPGTLVRVCNLFSKTPARRKFMRSPATEYAYIERMFIKLALASPAVALSLKRNGKVMYKLPACKDVSIEGLRTSGRLQELLGKDFVSHCIRVSSRTTDTYGLEGYILLPAHCKEQAKQRLVFVNRRFVQDRVIMHAMRQGYREMLHGNRQPEYVVFLRVPYDELDVNVHPTKTEVRFSHSNRVHRLVSASVRKTLQQPAATYPAYGVKTEAFKQGFSAAKRKPNVGINQTNANIALDFPPRDHPPATESGRRAPTDQELAKFLDISEPLAANALAATEASVVPDSSSSETPQAATQQKESLGVLGQAVAQMHGVYVLAINEKGLIILDMHAAHERIVFEALKAQYTKGSPEAQAFLLPEQLELPPADVLLIEEHLPTLKKWGFELRILGPKEVSVHSAPALIGTHALRELMSALCLTFREIGVDDASLGSLTEQQTEKVLSTLACYGSVRANKKLSLDEMNALLRKLEKTPGGLYCNHGRPTYALLTKEQLDRILMRGK